MSFLKLAERCEAATAEEQTVLLPECAIMCFPGGDKSWASVRRNEVFRLVEAGAFVDAALTLVPEEGWRMCRYHSPAPECHVVTLITDTLPAVAGGHAYTIALAICAAALRAWAAMEQARG